MVVFTLLSSFSFSMSVGMVQTVSKEKLGCIKGLGIKRVESIISYRESHELQSLEELLEIKGIGKTILNNIKEDKEKKVCTNFNQNREKKRESRKKDIKAE